MTAKFMPIPLTR